VVFTLECLFKAADRSFRKLLACPRFDARVRQYPITRSLYPNPSFYHEGSQTEQMFSFVY